MSTRHGQWEWNPISCRTVCPSRVLLVVTSTLAWKSTLAHALPTSERSASMLGKEKVIYKKIFSSSLFNYYYFPQLVWSHLLVTCQASPIVKSGGKRFSPLVSVFSYYASFQVQSLGADYFYFSGVTEECQIFATMQSSCSATGGPAAAPPLEECEGRLKS